MKKKISTQTTTMMTRTMKMSKSFEALKEALQKNAKMRSPPKALSSFEAGNPGNLDQTSLDMVKQGTTANLPPKDKPYPVPGSDDVVNARKSKIKKPTDKHDPPVEGGQKDVVNQGNSPVLKWNEFTAKAATKPTPAGRENPAGAPGDKSPVFRGTKIKDPLAEKTTLEETTVYDSVKRIAESGQSATVKFNDGDTASINPNTAKKLLHIEQNLSAKNASAFRRKLNVSPISLMNLLNLAKG